MMKKMIVMTLCLLLVLLSAGCGKKPAESGILADVGAELPDNGNDADQEKIRISAAEKDGDTTVRIEDVVYYNTKKAVPVEPDESVIVKEELLLDGSMSGEKITAYAFLREEQAGDTLVCLIDGEWYRFAATERVGRP